MLKGDDNPKDNAERLELAHHSHLNFLYAASFRLFAEAFTADPKAELDLDRGSRYDAACSAALAGTGQGDDAPAADPAARAKLRKRAHDLLKADLLACAARLEAGKSEDRNSVERRVSHWKVDIDLRGIRDEKELAKLPVEERTALKTLWSEVDELLAKTAPENQPSVERPAS